MANGNYSLLKERVRKHLQGSTLSSKARRIFTKFMNRPEDRSGFLNAQKQLERLSKEED
jgi:hypothetical protein